MLTHISQTFGYLLEDLNQEWLSNERLEEYSFAINLKGVPLPNCWGFIDGTVRPTCRPKIYQRQCYNGHKRTHALKYQSIIAANGLIANLFGPVEAHRHDAFVLAESQILGGLEQKVSSINRQAFCIYGDPAYPVRPPLIGPYKGTHLCRDEQAFNSAMSMSMNRIVVELGFGKILQLFAFVDFKKNQKLLLQPLSKHFKVSTILTNCHTCLYGSNTSKFFNLKPPSLENVVRIRVYKMS